jgi:hypothetical protein
MQSGAAERAADAERYVAWGKSGILNISAPVFHHFQ